MEFWCRLKKSEILSLDNPSQVWLVEKGSIILCRQQIDSNVENDRLFTIATGEALFSIDKTEPDLTIVAIATEETDLKGIELNDLADEEETRKTVFLYQKWSEKLQRLVFTTGIELKTNVTAEFYSKLESLTQQNATTPKQQLKKRQQLDDRVMRESLLKLVSVIQNSSEATGFRSGTPLLVSAGAVAKATGIILNPPPQSLTNNRIEDPIKVLARGSQFRIRRVLLKTNWWKQEQNALLGYRAEDKLPVALLPDAKGYVLLNPETKKRSPINQAIASTLAREAYQFYRPLPNTINNFWEIFRFAIKGYEQNIGAIFLVGIIATLIGMIVPQATALLVNRAIPDRDLSLLLQLGLALLAMALGKTAFSLSQGFIALRVETASSSALQLGVWDKLLRLSPIFFRKYSSGDLLERVLAIKQIYQLVSGSTRRTLFGAVFALLNLLLMFVYSWQLALVGMVTALVTAMITIAASWLMVRQLRRQQELSGELSGLTVQLINGISKLKVAMAEKRAFSTWIDLYAEQIKLKNITQKIQDNIGVFNEVSLLINSAFLYLIAISSIEAGDRGLTIGTFLAFNSALGFFLGGVTDLSNTITDILTIYPLWERAKPILQTEPEYDTDKLYPAVLEGQVSLKNITFRYQPDSLPVIKNISLKIQPGEFVAFVGASGSGKSTILRLLLGFETPQSGTVAYDGMDLAQLNLEAVRRQFGVVIQNGKLNQGSIYENIAAGALILEDEAWSALVMAGLAAEIKAMPMGLQTIVSEGGSNLSGGQRQRLLIARALVKQPKIIIMDEATSALDDRIQNIVTHSLDKLAVTRIVVAHRLSTIRNADRIYVFDAGKVVQNGNFTKLIEEKGLFRDLVESQLE